MDLFLLINRKRCVESSCAWMEMVTQRFHGNFKIRAYPNDACGSLITESIYTYIDPDRGVVTPVQNVIMSCTI